MEDVTLNSVLMNGDRHLNVVLTSLHIKWYYQETERANPQSTDTLCDQVALKDVFAIASEAVVEKKKRVKSNDIELLPTNRFAVHSVARGKNHRWKSKKIVFCCNEARLCKMWIDAVSNILKGFDRPRRLLIFINPVGGKKQGTNIFKEKVAPLLMLAGIDQNVIVTERANHAHSYVMNNDLQGLDGIVAVGGDGMFSEVLNGVLSLNTSGKHHSPIKLGLIPAGSTDTVVFCTTGANDPVSSTLHIIMGDQLPIDVCSVWHDDTLLKYSVSLMGYGFFGDVIRESEQLRWMGPRRYDIAGFRSFMANRSYAGEVSYIAAPDGQGDPRKRQRCVAGCLRCAEKDCNEGDAPNSAKSWTTIRGKFISVIGANITCRCAKSLDGISPNAHLGDGYFDLILIRKTTRTQYLRHMLRIANRGDLFGFDFIEVFRVKEFKFRPLSLIGKGHADGEAQENSDCDNHKNDLILREVSQNAPTPRVRNEEGVWNIDGELVEEPSLHVRVHRKLITIFARGIEETEETTTCSSCRPRSFES